MYNEAVLSRILIYGVLLTSLALVISTPALADSRTVLVLPFENQTDDRNLDWLGEGIAELILDRLEMEKDVYVFERDERLTEYERVGIPQPLSISRATAMKVGWDLGADVLVIGQMQGTHEAFTVAARVVDLADLQVSEDFKVSGKLEDVIQMAASLTAQLANRFSGDSAVAIDSAVPRSAFENYTRAILTQDPQRRTDLLREALRLYPQYSAAAYQLGRAYHLDRNFKSSNDSLETIAVVSREYLQAQFLRGLNHYYLGDFATAATVFFSMQPTYDVLINLGASLASQGDNTGALLAWKRASDTDPLGSDSVFNTGYWAFTRGDTEAAIRSFEHFMKLEGRDGEALFLLGRAYERLGRLDDSQRMISQATRLSPRVERWRTQPVPNLLRLSSTIERAELRLPLDTSLWNPERLARRAGGQDLNSLLELVQTQMDSQLYGEAIRQLGEIGKVFPASIDVLLMQVQIYESQREYDLALRTVQQALSLDPAHIEAIALKEQIERAIAASRRRP